MRQVVCSRRTGEVRLADVPAPACPPGGVVVRTRRSVVAPGTERQVIELARKSPLGKAAGAPRPGAAGARQRAHGLHPFDVDIRRFRADVHALDTVPRAPYAVHHRRPRKSGVLNPHNPHREWALRDFTTGVGNRNAELPRRRLVAARDPEVQLDVVVDHWRCRLGDRFLARFTRYGAAPDDNAQADSRQNDAGFHNASFPRG